MSVATDPTKSGDFAGTPSLALRGEGPVPPLRVVGRRVPKLDGREKVLGRTVFASDLNLPAMLVGKILRSPHAHAKIRSIDTSKAAKLPGVPLIIGPYDHFSAISLK